MFVITVFCICPFIESGTSRGVSWKPKSSHKLVNAFHLPPFLRGHQNFWKIRLVYPKIFAARTYQIIICVASGTNSQKSHLLYLQEILYIW